MRTLPIPLALLALACSGSDTAPGSIVYGDSFVTTDAPSATDSASEDAGLPPRTLDTIAPDTEPPWEEAPCTTAADCAGGWCVEGREGLVCTAPCTDACPDGWTCSQVAGQGADVAFICLPLNRDLCRPCGSDADCGELIGGRSVACLDYGAKGRFCGAPCDDAWPCPNGYACDGGQCRKDDEVCDCTAKFAAEGAETPCSAVSEVGSCGGARRCDATGEPTLEAAFRMAQAAHPGRVHVHIGYDEARAHRLVAGADAIALPSRFEPCGLTQLYGLRYGTLPIVRRVGGLADTVQNDTGVADTASTGFTFDAATPAAFAAAVGRAVAAFGQPERWQAMMRRAMARDLSWQGPARDYLALYEAVCQERRSAA